VFVLVAAVLLAAPAVSTDALREHALRAINQDRAEEMLPPLTLDGEASRIADVRAQEVLDGASLEVPVYLWYSQAGTNHSMQENLHAWTVSYDFTEHALRELIRRSQIAIMSDKPPHHGRRETILDPLATHAAIGLAWNDEEFQLVQLILRKYVHWATPLPQCAKVTDLVHVSGWPLDEVAFDAISVHHEPPPNAKRRAKKKAATMLVSNHALPKRRREYLPRLRSGYEYRSRGTGDVRTGKAGEFALDIPFTEGPGVYTVVVWTRFPTATEPFAATMASIIVE
jgi:hypothetical protein